MVVLGICLCTAKICYAQVPAGLYDALPSTLKPTDREKPSAAEMIKVLSVASDFNSRFMPGFINLATQLAKEADKSTVLAEKVKYLQAVTDYYDNYVSDSAIVYSKKLISVIGNNKLYYSNIPTLYLIIGTGYAYLDDYGAAMEAVRTAQALSGQIRDSLILVRMCGEFRFLYNRLQLYDSCMYYAHKAIAVYPLSKIDMPDHVMQLLNNSICYAYAYRKLNKREYGDTARSIIKRVMTTKKDEGRFWFNACYYFLGFIDFYDGNYAHAVTMFDSSALPQYNQTSRYTGNNFYGKYLYKAVSLIKLGQGAAGKAILDTLPIGKANFANKQIKYNALYELSVKNGNYKEALENYQLYKLYSDSLDLEGQKGRIFETEQKYQASQKQAAIARLENENLKKQKDNERILNIALVIFAVLTVIVVVLYIAYKRQQMATLAERQKLTDELNRIEQDMKVVQLRGAEEKNIAMLEQRKSISRSMHDEISPDLAALTFFIGDLKKKARDNHERELLEQVEEESRSVYQTARTFMHNLFNATVSTRYNVPEFLHNLSKRFDTQSSMQIVTLFDEAAINDSFTAEQHTEMYCIIKEAVANSMKYSGATLVHVNVTISNNRVVFEITDNGKGLSGINTGDKGLGLTSLKQRAAALNGLLEIADSGKGIHISGYFPLYITETVMA